MKQSWEMSLLQGAPSTSQGNSRLWEQWVLSFLQAKGLLGDRCGTHLAFSADWLPSGLPIWISVSWVQGTKKSREGMSRFGTWNWLASSAELWEEAVNFCKARLNFLYAPALTVYIFPQRRWLHFSLVLVYSPGKAQEVGLPAHELRRAGQITVPLSKT